MFSRCPAHEFREKPKKRKGGSLCKFKISKIFPAEIQLDDSVLPFFKDQPLRQFF
jgi:hypothetical protein